MTLDEIHEMWKRDSQLDEMNLDNASRDAAKLHMQNYMSRNLNLTLKSY